MVYAHQYAEEGIEKYPCRDPELDLHLRKANGGENKRDGREKEASFLMWENAQESDAGEGRYKTRRSEVGAAEKEQESHCRTEQLWEIYEKMLVTRVDAMLGKIRRIGIVQEIIQRRDDGTL